MERRRVGNLDVVALTDTVQSYPAVAVYPAAGETLGRFGAYLDSEGKLELNFASFLLIDGNGTVLVDTGWGPEFNGRLLEELAAAGVEAGSVNTVIFTHLHGDHTGWNIDRASGSPVFSNATYLVPRKDWDHYRAASPVPGSFSRDVAPLEITGHLELFDGERRLGDSATALPTPGHTPGHTSIALVSGGERGFILGDVVISPIDAELPSLQTSFDWDHAIAARTREATIAALAADGSLIGASHLPVPGFDRFVVEDGASRWVAG